MATRLMTVIDLFGTDVAFFDASDASTITVATNSVQKWVSKGTSVTANGAAGSYPTYNATGLNGNPALVFNGSTFLTVADPSFFPIGQNDFTAFGLFKGASTTANQVLLKWGADSGLLHNLFGYRNSGNNGWYTNRTMDAPGAFDLVANPDLFIADLRYSDGAIVKTSDNGTQAVSKGSGNPSIVTGTALIGSSGFGYLAGFNGIAGAVGVIRRKITDAERQKLVAILLWQWGLQANIPANNPDKAAAPTVTTADPVTVRRRPLILMAS